MKSVFLLFMLIIYAGEATAEYMFGMILDSSSNILQRPDGVSGKSTSLYSNVAFSPGKANLLYSFDGGILDRYDGVQFQHHSMDVSYNFISKKNITLYTVFNVENARYGDVTVLNGYKQYGISVLGKLYLTPSTLLRWKGDIQRRSYKDFDMESYSQADTYLRLDRFFSTGTTLRGQVDAGIRRYYKRQLTPLTPLLGFRARIAKSLGARWGVWGEAHMSRLNSSSLQDRSQLFDEVFIDDKYKYSSTGLVFNTKYLLRNSGSIQFKTAVLKRNYGSFKANTSWYLPQTGWKELEWRVFFLIARRPDFFPERIHPTFEIYYINVDASESDFTYNSTGISIRFELY